MRARFRVAESPQESRGVGGLGDGREGWTPPCVGKGGDCVLGGLGREESCEDRFHKCEPELRGVGVQLCGVRSQMLRPFPGAAPERLQMQVKGLGRERPPRRRLSRLRRALAKGWLYTQ